MAVFIAATADAEGLFRTDVVDTTDWDLGRMEEALVLFDDGWAGTAASADWSSSTVVVSFDFDLVVRDLDFGLTFEEEATGCEAVMKPISNGGGDMPSTADKGGDGTRSRTLRWLRLAVERTERGGETRRLVDRVLRKLIAEGDGDAFCLLLFTNRASSISSSTSSTLVRFLPRSRVLRGELGDSSSLKQRFFAQEMSLSS